MLRVKCTQLENQYEFKFHFHNAGIVWGFFSSWSCMNLWNDGLEQKAECSRSSFTIELYQALRKAYSLYIVHEMETIIHILVGP